MKNIIKNIVVSISIIFCISCDKKEIIPEPITNFEISKSEANILDTIIFTNESDADYAVIWTGDSGHVFTSPESSENGKSISATNKYTSYIYKEPGIFTITFLASNEIGEGEFKHSAPLQENIEIIASGNSFTSFGFEGLTDTDGNPVIGGNTGVITGSIIKVGKIFDEFGNLEDDKSIPFAANLTNLSPSFEVSDFAKVYVNETEQISGVTKLDFSNSVEYKVIAHNGESKLYTVLVEQKAPKTFAKIREFGLKDLVSPIEIDSDQDTISITVPNGTDITSLVAVFEKTSYSIVTVNGIRQWSGETVNNFSEILDYKVVSEDGKKEKHYHVEVKISNQ